MKFIDKIKKTICFACVGIVACSALAACNKEEPLDAQHGIADQTNLFGMCYLLEERNVASLNIEKEVEIDKNKCEPRGFYFPSDNPYQISSAI